MPTTPEPPVSPASPGSVFGDRSDPHLFRGVIIKLVSREAVASQRNLRQAHAGLPFPFRVTRVRLALTVHHPNFSWAFSYRQPQHSSGAAATERHAKSNTFCRLVISLNAPSGATRGPCIVKAASQLGWCGAA